MKEYIKKYRLHFLFVAGLAVLSAVATVGISLVLQYAIDISLKGKIKEAVIITIIFIVCFGAIYYLSSAGQVSLNQRLMEAVRGNIINKILQKSYTEFDEHHDSDYISLLTNDVKKIEDGYIQLILSALEMVVQLSLAIVVMTHYSWVFTVVMLAMTILMFVIPTYFTGRLRRATDELSHAQEKLTQSVAEVVQGFEVIKSFGQEKSRLNKFDIVNHALRGAGSKLGYTKTANAAASNVLAFSMQLVICLLAAYFIWQNKISYGSMVGVIQVSGSITSPLFGLFSTLPMIKSLKPIWSKIAEYTQTTQNTVSDFPALTDWHSITLENIDFTYPEAREKTLKNVFLNIERSKKYLIIGESGGGKSTLTKLISGYYSADTGEILIDGKPTKATSQMLQNTVAMVRQDIFLFDESIGENIYFDNEDKSKLAAIIRQTNIKSIIDDKGIDFRVGENGSLLSGGQRQRIAIARAMYAGRSIIILDEGFSALDPKTSAEIENTLLEDKDLTLLSISHHYSPELAARYDGIIEVHAGQVRVSE